MIRRLLILQVLLLAGLSSIWLLPSAPETQYAALNPELPKRLTLSGWTSYGELIKEGSKEEKARLASDTEFFRRHYRRERSMTEQPRDKDILLVDELNTGIVLSGKDLSGSIHALERCLNAQGFNIPSASTMRITLRSGQVLPVRRLVCEKVTKDNNVQRSIAYYWFVGHDSVTSNHIKRGLKDFWDRIVHGYDQRWAYITVTAYLNGGYLYEEPKEGQTLKEGEAPPKLRDAETRRELARLPITEDEADKMVDEFIGDLGPDIMKVDQIKEWPEE